LIDTPETKRGGAGDPIALPYVTVPLMTACGVGVKVSVAVAVGVKVLVAVAVAVAVFVEVAVGVNVFVAVAVAVAVFVKVAVGVNVLVAVAVGVNVLVAVDVGVKVLVEVAVAVGVPPQDVPPVLNIKEKRLIEPVSTPALSETLSTQVPFALSPSSNESAPVVSGEKLPDCGDPVTLVNVEMFGKPPSSLRTERQMFSRVPPRLAWNATVGEPSGGVSLNVKSPMNV
jgi:hypothetical protein